MERYREAADYAVKALKKAGAADASCYIRSDEYTEANVECGDFSLLRTYSDTSAELTAIVGKKCGTARLSQLDRVSIDESVSACMEAMRGAADDEYAAVADDTSVNGSYTEGELVCDSDGLLSRTAELIDAKVAKGDKAEELITSHVRSKRVYESSRGVMADSDQGYYQNGSRAGSAYYRDMKSPITGIGEFDYPFDKKLLKEPFEPIGDTFEGTIVLGPRMVKHMWWLAMFVCFGENNLTGENGAPRNLWADKIGQQVASPLYNLSNCPRDPRFCGAPFFTKDGCKAENADFIVNGMLKNLPADAHTARKLGVARTMSPLDYLTDEVVKCNFIIKPGEESINDIISGVERGIVAFGLPGCCPHDPSDGDFSSVVRGAALIEDGKITRHVSELMVTHNFFEMFRRISAVSSEHYFTGGDIAPWVAFDGFTIKG